MIKDNLPELPEPLYLGGDEAYGDIVRGYVADQMRTYGHQCRAVALEEAAKLIEQTQETHIVNAPEGQTNERTVTPRKAHNLMGLAYAAAIRALNKTEG